MSENIFADILNEKRIEAAMSKLPTYLNCATSKKLYFNTNIEDDTYYYFNGDIQYKFKIGEPSVDISTTTIKEQQLEGWETRDDTLEIVTNGMDLSLELIRDCIREGMSIDTKYAQTANKALDKMNVLIQVVKGHVKNSYLPS